MLLLALVQSHDCLADLTHQIAAKVRRFEVEGQRNLAQQVERSPGGVMNVQGFIKVGIERRREHTRRRRLAGPDFAGKQTNTVMLREKLQPRVDLLPGCGGEQLLLIRAVAEGRFLEAE